MSENPNYFLTRWQSQLKKGLFEYIIMLLLQKKERYGYELISDIKGQFDMDIADGTIYPLLNRLKKEKIVESRWVEMEEGIPRKYYQLTDLGKQQLEEMYGYLGELMRAISELKS
ncbi:MAG: PadR family transcriptional regulator [Chitinophagaceae bacterium]|uniref:PadR family transcriptional regulator n=1 Tax=Parasegetibacter sp. NRK P23 TaxID=2942999 RepID=UPI002044B5A2|nr:PadR family transcriptional regulator [Parasegetibacter sp. NRK P23]MCM5530344.1 PadR family transcriptional regulator [Parasegetibacter sp. NRK P23]